jgi:hypothetical protein
MQHHLHLSAAEATRVATTVGGELGSSPGRVGVLGDEDGPVVRVPRH